MAGTFSHVNRFSRDWLAAIAAFDEWLKKGGRARLAALRERFDRTPRPVVELVPGDALGYPASARVARIVRPDVTPQAPAASGRSRVAAVFYSSRGAVACRIVREA